MIISSARIEALKQRSTHVLAIWQPAVGDKIIGVVVYSDYDSKVIKLQDCDDKVWIVNMDTRMWADYHYKMWNIRKEVLVCITALGCKLLPSGRKYKAYSVVVEKLYKPGLPEWAIAGREKHAQ